VDLNRLAELRRNHNWSLQDVADHLGIAKSTYAGYESGYRRPPLEALKAMADLFQTSVDYLIGRTDDVNQKVELTDLKETTLFMDGIELSNEEIVQFIAFIRAKRELENIAKE